jgi:uncharacterized protein (TIGR02246 family)
MRRLKVQPLFSLACLLGLASFTISVDADTSSGRKAAQANETEVREVYERWATAFRSHDLDAIMSLYGPEESVVAYDWIPPLQRRGRAAYRESYRELLDQYSGPIAVEFRDLRVVAGDDVAFIHALQHMTGMLKSGEKSDVWGRVTSGLRKIHGRWLIVHDHGSVPADFETGKAAMDLKP